MIARHWMRPLSRQTRVVDARRELRKLGRTLRLLWALGCARTLGEYENSGWNGDHEYARYRWRGKSWIIPTGPVDEEQL